MLTGAASQAQPLAQHGTNQHAEAEGEDLRTEGPKKWGETQSYLLRRLARDAPEILERIKKAPDLQTQRIGSTADAAAIRRRPNTCGS